jgi:hypothetical protein
MTAFIGRGYKVSGKVRQKKENQKDHAEDPLLCFLFAWRCRKVQYQDRATLGYRKQPALVIGRALQRRYSAKEIRKLGYQFLNCQKMAIVFFGEREIHQWPNDQNG